MGLASEPGAPFSPDLTFDAYQLEDDSWHGGERFAHDLSNQEEMDFWDYMAAQGYPQEEEYEQNPDAYEGGYNPPDPNLGGASGVSPKGPSQEEYMQLVDEFNRQRGNETPQTDNPASPYYRPQ